MSLNKKIVLIVCVLFFLFTPTAFSEASTNNADVVITVKVDEKRIYEGLPSFYQGEDITLSTTIVNNEGNKIQVAFVKIRYDWKDSEINFVDEPFELTPNESFSRSYTTAIPKNVEIGNHELKVRIDYQGESNFLGLRFYFPFGYTSKGVTLNFWIESSEVILLEIALNQIPIEYQETLELNFESEGANNVLQNIPQKIQSAQLAFSNREWEKTSSLIDEIKNTILDAFAAEDEFLISKLTTEIKNAEIEDFVYIDAKNDLDQAKTQLNLARGKYDSGDYEGSFQTLRDARSTLNNAFEKEAEFWLSDEGKRLAETKIEIAKKEIQKLGFFGPLGLQEEFDQKLSNISDYLDRGETKEAYRRAISLAQEARNKLLMWIGSIWGLITSALTVVAGFKTSLNKKGLLLLFIILFLVGLFLLRMYLQI